MAIFVRPHAAVPANRIAAIESQVIQLIQGVMGQTLSGFVMAMTYGNTFKGAFSMGTFLSFLGKRLGRIYPLYLFITAAVAILVYTHSIVGDPPSGRTIVTNVVLAQSWGLAPNIGGPTWSISTEFAAYLAFPALVAVVLAGRAYFAVAAATTSVAALLILANLDASTLNQLSDGLPNRSGPLDIAGDGTLYPLIRCFAGFILGLAAFRLLRDHATSRAATWRHSGDLTAMLVVALLFIHESDVGLEIAFALLVITLASSPSRTAAAMGGRSIFWLGEISYSIYLVHRPIEGLVRNPLIAILNRHHVPHAYTVGGLAPLLLVIPVSVLTYYGIEKPARNWSRRVMGQRTPPIAMEPSAP